MPAASRTTSTTSSPRSSAMRISLLDSCRDDRAPRGRRGNQARGQPRRRVDPAAAGLQPQAGHAAAPLDLNEVIDSIRKLLANWSATDIELHDRPSTRDLGRPGRSRQLEQVLMNLAVERARRDAGGRPPHDRHGERGRCGRTTHGAPGDCGRDASCGSPWRTPGAGIPEDVRPHIFEPFFTTKEQGEGNRPGPGDRLRDREAERRVGLPGRDAGHRRLVRIYLSTTSIRVTGTSSL